MKKYTQSRLQIVLILFMLVFVLGVVGFMIIEDANLYEAIYYCIVTISTVGYGDITPDTNSGRIFTVLLIVFGVGTFLGVIANTSDHMLSRRDRIARKRKTSILVGLFFSELGCCLITFMAKSDPDLVKIQRDLSVKVDWDLPEFEKLKGILRKYKYDIIDDSLDFDYLDSILSENKEFMVRLLENPVLLEHENFTELLHSVFHLYQEMTIRMRRCNRKLEPEDLEHLHFDIKRIYKQIVIEWVDYLRYLKKEYPYLYKYSVNTNPFNEIACSDIDTNAKQA